MPSDSSKWEDINRDLVMAQTVEPLLPSLSVETLTLAIDGALVPRAKLEGTAHTRPALAASGGGRGGATPKTRPRD